MAGEFFFSLCQSLRQRIACVERRHVRRAVDAALAAVTLSLAVIVALNLQSIMPASQETKAARGAELETAILQPRMAPGLPVVSAANSTPQRDTGLVAVPPEDPAAQPSQVAAMDLALPAPAPEADANAVAVDGVTYVKGRDPHSLGTVAVPEQEAGQ